MGLEISEITQVMYEHSDSLETAQSDIATLTARELTFEATIKEGGTNMMANSTFGGMYAPDLTGWHDADSVGAFLDRWGYLTVTDFLAIWGTSAVANYLANVDKC